ncbi:MAG: hypothetical protein JJV98_18455, partial [Desulfosarcina sp.]|nr:hypothetical protein [Desulfobacterales bacterium]
MKNHLIRWLLILSFAIFGCAHGNSSPKKTMIPPLTPAKGTADFIITFGMKADKGFSKTMMYRNVWELTERDGVYYMQIKNYTGIMENQSSEPNLKPNDEANCVITRSGGVKYLKLVPKKQSATQKTLNKAAGITLESRTKFMYAIIKMIIPNYAKKEFKVGEAVDTISSEFSFFDQKLQQVQTQIKHRGI